MKIIQIVVGKANPDRMNGVNVVVHQMATEMKRQNYDVSVWGLSQSEGEVHARDYDLQIFDQNPNSFFLTETLKNALSTIEQHTIIHFHGAMIPAFHAIAKILKPKNIEWVVTPHSALQPQSLKRGFIKKYLYLKLFDRFFLNNAKAIQALTQQEKTIIAPWTNTQTVIIPNGFNADVVAGNLYSKNFVVGYIGRMDIQHKGLDLLVDGFLNFLEQGGTGKLWLIGDGPDKKRLKSHISGSRFKKKIIFQGPKFGLEKIELLQKISVFIHPSRWDTTPISILEAAWHQKPIIASVATGFGDAIDKWDCGFVLQQNSVEEISHAIENCMKLHYAAELEKMGQQAAMMVQTDYNWRDIVAQITGTLYQVQDK